MHSQIGLGVEMKYVVGILGLLLSITSYAHDDEHDHTMDSIMVHAPKIKTNPPGVKNTAAYFHLMNDGDTDLTLIEVKSSAAKIVEIHEHSMKDGLMKMQRIDSLGIPAKTTINFEPGGYHIMFINLNQDLKEGDKVEIELVFNNGAKKEVVAVAVEKVLGGSHSNHTHGY
jgi:copper(I)-binding protein